MALVLEVLVLLVMDAGVLADRGTTALDITSFDPSVLASSGGMAGMFVLVIAGRTGAVNAALLVPLPVVLVAGVVVALRIRRTDPGRYARLTEVDVERD
ncbi:hypothetical protein OG978_35390 [Streptomyces sp. NBC_01591]|uniref:hypothetical protein n=1 Tax=Streptomyces sp. NBC_01591 TaxID=2975888 RepID=UPI002DDBCD15|nr:hypothetical protein [Streptomyces sp. NBC_01591]WSD72219.1 hypothetical protein OG978_35390 [Streptomyces sp. NBC_01591]